MLRTFHYKSMNLSNISINILDKVTKNRKYIYSLDDNFINCLFTYLIKSDFQACPVWFISIENGALPSSGRLILPFICS